MSEDFNPEVDTDKVREYVTRNQLRGWQLIVELCDVIDELRARLEEE